MQLNLHAVFALMVSAGIANAQNTSPVISNVAFNKDAQNFTANYNLADADNDDCEVIVRLSLDGGRSFNKVASTLGVGFPVSPGNGKQISFPSSELDSAQFGIPPIVRIIATDRKAVDIQQMVNQVDSNNLYAHLLGIPFPRFFNNDAANVSLTKNYLESFLIQQNLPTYRQDFPYSSYTAHNIHARQSGYVSDTNTYIVDAHFDGVTQTPGADDNGSGVAGVMEAARILSNYHFENTIRYIGFDLEELGTIGSQRYVQSGIPSYERTKGVVNFEMIGYYSEKANTQTFPQGFDLLFASQSAAVKADSSRGNFIVNCSDASSGVLANAFDSAATKYVPALRVISLPVPGTGTIAPDLRRSDHSRFWDAGIPALMITDGANFRNTQYHTKGDSIERLNFTFMSNVVKAAVGTIATLAKPMSAARYDIEVLETGIEEHDHHHKTGCALQVSRSRSNLGITFNSCRENFGKGTIRIFSLDGKMHHSMDIADGSQKTFNANVQLVPGTYIVVADNGHEAVNGKLLVD